MNCHSSSTHPISSNRLCAAVRTARVRTNCLHERRVEVRAESGQGQTVGGGLGWFLDGLAHGEPHDVVDPAQGAPLSASQVMVSRTEDVAQEQLVDADAWPGPADCELVLRAKSADNLERGLGLMVLLHLPAQVRRDLLPASSSLLRPVPFSLLAKGRLVVVVLGRRSSVQAQIGNAVPPLLGNKVAEAVMDGIG
jgi:hypothetical protein